MCTFNVTLRHVHATIVAVEKQRLLHNVSVCICSLSYPACSAHAPYCCLWPAPLCSIFSHFLINGMIFKKHSLSTKCEFWLSIQHFSEIIFHCRKKWARYDKKMYNGLNVKYALFLSDFNETWIFARDFRNFHRLQILWKSVQWEPRCSMWTDRHDDVNSRFSQFLERA